jgi:surface protein
VNALTGHSFDPAGSIYMRADVTTSDAWHSSGYAQTVAIWGGSTSGSGGWRGWIQNNRIGMDINSASGGASVDLTDTSLGGLNLSTRYILEFFYDMTRNKVKFWVNGVEVSPAGGISENFYPSDGSLSIGYTAHSSGGSNFFGGNTQTGTIHEVSVYDCKPPPEPFTDRAALKTAVDACLSAVPSGEACCSTDPACTDRSSTTYRCGAAVCTDMPDWDVSLVTDMSELFKAKAQFNVNISAWDTSQVTDMQYMLHTATNFNKDIGDWNVGRVTNMQLMFAGARNFNGDLSRWDVGSVRNMGSMFLTARKFAGGDLSSWNTSKVTNMRGMFACGDPSPSANVFNGDVSTWDVSSVTDMNNMFIRAGAFNQDISSWSTSKVTDMNNMFQGATSFNQDISSWNTSQVTDMRYMFKKAAAFYQDITGWSDASLTTGMFTGATAWLDRVQRGDGTGTSTDGPISDWVHKPCLIDERVQSGWCVPCEYNHVNAQGDDPAASVDTACDELTCCQSKMKRVGMIIKRK